MILGKSSSGSDNGKLKWEGDFSLLLHDRWHRLVSVGLDLKIAERTLTVFEPAVVPLARRIQSMAPKSGNPKDPCRDVPYLCFSKTFTVYQRLYAKVGEVQSRHRLRSAHSRVEGCSPI